MLYAKIWRLTWRISFCVIRLNIHLNCRLISESIIIALSIFRAINLGSNKFCEVRNLINSQVRNLLCDITNCNTELIYRFQLLFDRITTLFVPEPIRGSVPCSPRSANETGKREAAFLARLTSRIKSDARDYASCFWNAARLCIFRIVTINTRLPYIAIIISYYKIT